MLICSPSGDYDGDCDDGIITMLNDGVYVCVCACVCVCVFMCVCVWVCVCVSCKIV